MNISEIRYKNAKYLSDSVGGINACAEKLEKSQPQISHLIGERPIKNIGNKIARQFEVAFNKPANWLDVPHYELWQSVIQNESKLLDTDHSQSSPQVQIETDLSRRQQIFLELFDALPTVEQDKLLRELEEKKHYFEEIMNDLKKRAG